MLPPATPRAPPCLLVWDRSTREAWRAGTSPNSTLVTTETASVNASMVASTPPVASRRTISAGASATSPRELPVGEQDAGDPGDQREQQALCEQLPDDARTTCAERRPQGYFPGSAGRLAQEQRGRVGARDQEHQPGDHPRADTGSGARHPPARRATRRRSHRAPHWCPGTAAPRRAAMVVNSVRARSSVTEDLRRPTAK